MRRSATNKKGFSLLEVLVAAVILLVLLAILARVLHMSGDIWAGGRSRSETRRVVRALQDLLRSDLQAAALPIDGSIAPGRGNLQLVINPPSVPDFYRNADVAFWQAPVATDRSEGIFAELGYFIRWRDNRATLCRLFLNPSQSRVLLGSTDVLQRVYQHPDDWVNEAVLEAGAPADREHGYLGLFAENVIGFWVRPLDRQGAVAYNVGKDGFDSNVDFDGQSAPVLPPCVEISFVLIDPFTANLLAERSDAEAVVARLKALANASREASPQSPAVDFIARLESEANLRFLRKSARPHQMLVHLQ